MNTVIALDIHPLPSPLFTRSRAGRRHHVDSFEPDPDALSRFNSLLARLGWQRAPLDCDQLASAARALPAPVGAGEADCIDLRLQQVRRLNGMLGDPDWEVDAHALPAAHEVVAYLNADWHLLPGDLPRAGHLDDAIALDTAWPLLRPELCNYQDFRRLRTLEAEHRGCRYEDVAFDRQAWREAREMEARLHEQLRRIRDTSYAPAAPACFRVH